jgi:hypothetical protein
VKSYRDTVAKALEGDYRREHVFTLKQSLSGYQYYQQQIKDTDETKRSRWKCLPSSEHARPKLPR